MIKLNPISINHNNYFMNKKYPFLIVIFLLTISAFSQNNISADSLKKHVYFLADDSLEGRGIATKGGQEAASYISRYFEEIGLKTIGSDYKHTFYLRNSQTMLIGHNVVGLIEGSDPNLKNEYIVIGAHDDHISYGLRNHKKVVYNGADDNASGTSAIIELARALNQNKSSLKRSIVIVAFDGEESGLNGSTDFVFENIIPKHKIKLMMSIDMVGRYAESKSLIVGAMASLKGGDEILMNIADKHGVEIKKTGKRVSNRTDSKPFGMFGIPALHITSGIIGPYHKPEDDANTLDYIGMAKISNLLYDLILNLANEDQLEPIAKMQALAKNGGVPFFRYGSKASFGRSHHSYYNEFYNGKNRFSGELGMLTQLKLTKNFSLQPEFLYATMASDYSTGNFRTHSFTIPLSLMLATTMNREQNMRLFLNIGAYYSYHFSGKANGISLDFENSYEREEQGLVYGFGIEASSVIVSFNGKYGLSNLEKDPLLKDFTNRAIYFSLAYLFN